MNSDKGGEITAEFEAFVKETLPGVKILRAELPMHTFSTTSPEDLVEMLLLQIDETFEAGRYDSIKFIAFSSGAPIARYALMKAYGVDPNGKISTCTARKWTGPGIQIRVVNLAGILQGWKFSTAMPAHVRFLALPISFLTSVVCLLWYQKRPFILQQKHGACFIVTGQLMQLALRDLTDDESLPFEQINFLGTRDEYISPADCIELNSNKSSIFVEVPSTNHLQMLKVDDANSENEEDIKLRQTRRKYFARALTESFPNLAADREYSAIDDDVNDYFDELDRPHIESTSELNRQVEHAVIVLHGIRDNGFWTKRVARKLKEGGGVRPLLRVPSPSYGFFSLLDFVRKNVRTRQAQWLLKQYVEVRECYPNAKISFVGHSNGTYLAKSAMEQCTAVRFERIVFAGSVVRTDLDWAMFSGQINSGVLNLMGQNDRVVALLPGAMERLGLRFLDVGGAGFSGFNDVGRRGMNVQNVRISGGHGAGISEHSWEKITKFIQDGTVPIDTIPIDTDNQPNLLGRFAPILFLLCLAAASGLLFGLFRLIGTDSFMSAIFLLVVGWLVFKILRQF
ncbi:MAG: hypothetical protein ABJH07_08105 [Sedimentitalea sp.]|uniref:hypothetical protein n=1 Tax=Sedimentitalea sp. TaxID=2048915 RepID=UPI003265772E